MHKQLEEGTARGKGMCNGGRKSERVKKITSDWVLKDEKGRASQREEQLVQRHSDVQVLDPCHWIA